MRWLILALLLAGCGDTIVQFDAESPMDGHWRGEVLSLDNRKDTLDLWIDFSGMSNWDGTGQYVIHQPGRVFSMEAFSYIDGDEDDFALTVAATGANFGFSGRMEGDRLLLNWRGTSDRNTYALLRQH